MFEGFSRTLLATPEATICVRQGGSGPPLLLLHGHPQTHVMWHLTAPALARDYTVICAAMATARSRRRRPITRATPSGRWRAIWSR
jgi:pimeloyl-ACP methyl ester carboxylesterase